MLGTLFLVGLSDKNEKKKQTITIINLKSIKVVLPIFVQICFVANCSCWPNKRFTIQSFAGTGVFPLCPGWPHYPNFPLCIQY